MLKIPKGSTSAPGELGVGVIGTGTMGLTGVVTGTGSAARGKVLYSLEGDGTGAVNDLTGGR